MLQRYLISAEKLSEIGNFFLFIYTMHVYFDILVSVFSIIPSIFSIILSQQKEH